VVAADAGLGDELRCFTLAESLGGVESLIAHPATMTHASMDAEARAKAGISDSLLRLSVGIELGTDLVADLERALDLVLLADVPRDLSPLETEVTLPGSLAWRDGAPLLQPVDHA
jgi:cystathionine gamma-synthase